MYMTVLLCFDGASKTVDFQQLWFTIEAASTLTDQDLPSDGDAWLEMERVQSHVAAVRDVRHLLGDQTRRVVVSEEGASVVASWGVRGRVWEVQVRGVVETAGDCVVDGPLVVYFVAFRLDAIDGVHTTQIHLWRTSRRHCTVKLDDIHSY